MLGSLYYKNDKGEVTAGITPHYEQGVCTTSHNIRLETILKHNLLLKAILKILEEKEVIALSGSDPFKGQPQKQSDLIPEIKPHYEQGVCATTHCIRLKAFLKSNLLLKAILKTLEEKGIITSLARDLMNQLGTYHSSIQPEIVNLSKMTSQTQINIWIVNTSRSLHKQRSYQF